MEFLFFVAGTLDKVINNEVDLRNAINNVQNKVSTVITLGNGIILAGALIISTVKDIILTSNKASEFCKL